MKRKKRKKNVLPYFLAFCLSPPLAVSTVLSKKTRTAARRCTQCGLTSHIQADADGYSECGIVRMNGIHSSALMVWTPASGPA